MQMPTADSKVIRTRIFNLVDITAYSKPKDLKAIMDQFLVQYFSNY